MQISMVALDDPLRVPVPSLGSERPNCKADIKFLCIPQESTSLLGVNSLATKRNICRSKPTWLELFHLEPGV